MKDKVALPALGAGALGFTSGAMFVGAWQYLEDSDMQPAIILGLGGFFFLCCALGVLAILFVDHSQPRKRRGAHIQTGGVVRPLEPFKYSPDLSTPKSVSEGLGEAHSPKEKGL